jgi:hypothetical protein
MSMVVFTIILHAACCSARSWDFSKYSNKVRAVTVVTKWVSPGPNVREPLYGVYPLILHTESLGSSTRTTPASSNLLHAPPAQASVVAKATSDGVLANFNPNRPLSVSVYRCRHLMGHLMGHSCWDQQLCPIRCLHKYAIILTYPPWHNFPCMSPQSFKICFLITGSTILIWYMFFV